MKVKSGANMVKKRVIFYGFFAIFIVIALSVVFIVSKQNERFRNSKIGLLAIKNTPVIDTRREALLKHSISLGTLAAFRALFFHGLGLPLVSWNTLPEEEKNSDWDVKERNKVSKLSIGNTYDIIVLPVQMQRLESDKISRILSAQIVADEIRSTTGKTVMPVQLAQALIGEHVYRISERTVSRLAKEYKAKTVISLFAGETRAAIKRYQFGYYMKTNGEQGKARIFPLDKFSDTSTLEMMIWKKAGAILKSMYPDAKAYKTVSYKTDPNPQLGLNINSLLASGKDPYTQAVNFELLAALTSHIEFNERNGYMERALISLRHVDPSTKNYDVLFARAMFYLYRRPLALEYINKENTPEANALREMLNGNYPELKKAVFKIKDPVFRLFSYFDVNDLAYQYGSEIRTSNKGEFANYMQDEPGWAKLVENRRRDQDGWYGPNATRLLFGMSNIFPDISKTFIDLIKQKSVVGDVDYDNYKSQFIFMDAYKKILEEDDHKLRTGMYGQRLTRYDLLRFYRSIGISSILRQIDKDVNVYDLPGNALELSNQASNYFAGNISYLKRKAEIDSSKLASTQGDEHLKYLKRIINTSLLIKNLNSSTDENSVYAEYYIYKYFGEYEKNFPSPTNTVNSAYQAGNDVPSGFRLYEFYGYPDALDYTYDRFSLLEAAYKNHGNTYYTKKMFTMDQLKHELSSRFDGHRDKIIFIADRYEKNGDMGSVLKVLNKAVSEKSENWHVYLKLGKIYLHKGKYNKASKIFNSYPLFKNSDRANKVGLSNSAYTAGTLLFFAGDYKDAIPLYEYSAKLDTGSSGSLSAAFRLYLLDNKYLAALKLARYNARRYNNEFRYRDYLNILSMLGYSDQAQEGFKVLAPRFGHGQAWLSLFVSQRIRGFSFDKMVDWVQNYEKGQSSQVVKDANGYLLLQSLTDRKLNQKQYQKLYSAFHAGIKIRYKNLSGITKSDLYQTLTGNKNELPDKNPQAQQREEASKKHAGYVTNSELLKLKKLEHSLHSIGEFDGFLKAYQQLMNGEFKKAYTSFAIYSNFFPVKGGDYKVGTLIVPYVAYAAIKTGNSDKMAAYLKSYKELPASAPFDYYLTQSVIEAGKHNIGNSLKFLDDAFNNRPEVDQRAVFYWYELTQFCVWLSDTTHDKRYVEKALEWAKTYEIIQPQYGWAYAFEAKYSGNSAARIRAAAFAQYLDPNSHWLSTVPKAIRIKGKRWWKKNNPYVIQNDNNNQNRMKT